MPKAATEPVLIIFNSTPDIHLETDSDGHIKQIGDGIVLWKYSSDHRIFFFRDGQPFVPNLNGCNVSPRTSMDAFMEKVVKGTTSWKIFPDRPKDFRSLASGFWAILGHGLLYMIAGADAKGVQWYIPLNNQHDMHTAHSCHWQWNHRLREDGIIYTSTVEEIVQLLEGRSFQELVMSYTEKCLMARIGEVEKQRDDLIARFQHTHDFALALVDIFEIVNGDDSFCYKEKIRERLLEIFPLARSHIGVR